MSKAHDSLNEMLLKHQKTNVYIKIPNSDYFGDIIGAKGSNINEIKKEFKLSRITLSRDDNTIFIAAKDEDMIEKVKDMFQKNVSTSGEGAMCVSRGSSSYFCDCW